MKKRLLETRKALKVKQARRRIRGHTPGRPRGIRGATDLKDLRGAKGALLRHAGEAGLTEETLGTRLGAPDAAPGPAKIF